MESFIWYQRPLLACKREPIKERLDSIKEETPSKRNVRRMGFHILTVKVPPCPLRMPVLPWERVISKICTAYFDVAEVVASMAVKASVDQYCIQDINNRFPVWLRHVRSDVKVLRVFHILNRNGEGEKGTSFPRAQIALHKHVETRGDPTRWAACQKTWPARSPPAPAPIQHAPTVFLISSKHTRISS